MENRSSYKKNYFEIFKGGSIALAGTMAGYLLNYAFKTVTGRYFGPEGLGIMAYGISLMTVVSMLAVMGFDEGLGRFIPFYRNKQDYGSIRTILVFCTKVSFAVSLAVGGIVYFAAAAIALKIFKDPGAEGIIRVFALLVPIQTFFMLSTGLARGLKKMAAIAIARDIIMWTVKIAGAAVIVYCGFTVEYVAAVFFAAFLVAGTYYYRTFNKEELAARLRASRPVRAARDEFLKFSSLLIFSNLIQLLRKRTDILLIGFFLPAASVGLYYAVLPFAMTLTIFLFSINRIIMPVVSELVSSGETENTRRLFKEFAVFCFQLTLPIFLFIFFFSDTIVHIVYGEKFAGAGSLLGILSIGFFLNAASGSYGEFFKAFNKPQLYFYINTAGSVLNVFLLALFTAKWGITGAAWATTATLSFIVVAGLLVSHLALKLNPFNRNYWLTLAAGVVFFSVIAFLHGKLQLHLGFPLFLLMTGIYFAFIAKTANFLSFFSYLKKRV